MSETGNYFGGSLGLGLLGAAAAVVYRAHTHGSSDSLPAALAASSHLPASQAAATLHTARAAFTAGVHVMGLIAAVIFAALLVLAMRPAGPQPEEQPEEQSEQPQPPLEEPAEVPSMSSARVEF